MKRKSCKGCYFHRKLVGGGTEFACHYCLDTGELRVVPAEECDKKLLVTPAQRKRLNDLRKNNNFEYTSDFLKFVMERGNNV